MLTRDPLCVICLRAGRTVVSTVADHWPVDRRELVARGMDPDDPSGGRGLCASCHGKETAIHQPGGWANR